MSGGHGFCGIGRKRLLNMLQERARELGVHQAFSTRSTTTPSFGDADLIIAADGVNSRDPQPARGHVFQPDVDVRKCRFIWLGTTQHFAAFTFAFEQTEHGWFQIHAYQFSKELSTVIVETREETWAAHGLDQLDTEQSIAFCEQLFGRYLGGHRLQSNATTCAARRGSISIAWLCKRWHHGNTVLIGDAAHTAHFSIGSGTKLAMEDAISLSPRHRDGDRGSGRRARRVSRGAPASRCSSCRAPRAIAWNGSRTSRAMRTCRRSSSPTAC